MLAEERQQVDLADAGHGEVVRLGITVKDRMEALEAWARENDHPRSPEETPHEFAQKLRQVDAALGSAARG